MKAGFVFALSAFLGVALSTGLHQRASIAHAAGVGPEIVIGSTSIDSNGNVIVPVLTAGSNFDPYAGVQVHLRWNPTVFSLGGLPSPNPTIFQTPICVAPILDADGGGAIFGCADVTLTAHTDTGIVASIALTPIGSGCGNLHLFTYGAPDGGDALTGTYSADFNAFIQMNTYGPDVAVCPLKPLTYIAAGDSIVAGSDLGSGDVAHNNPLGASDYRLAYPATLGPLYSTHLGKPIAVTNIGCDGETSSSFISGADPNSTDSNSKSRHCSLGPTGSKSQLNYLQTHRSALTTITIGADDLIQFAQTHSACMFSLVWPPVNVGPLRCGSAYQAMKRTLSANLQRIYSTARGRSQRVVVTGYYHLYCQSSPVLPENINAAIDDLNAVISGAAARAGVSYVGVEASFVSHENAIPLEVAPCRDTWLTPRLSCSAPGVLVYACDVSAHPTAYGQRQFANAIMAKIAP